MPAARIISPQSLSKNMDFENKPEVRKRTIKHNMPLFLLTLALSLAWEVLACLPRMVSTRIKRRNESKLARKSE